MLVIIRNYLATYRLRLSLSLLGLVSLLFIGLTPAHAGNGSVTYTYDALGRVVSATYDTGAIIYYSYDANGNRTQQTTGLATGTLTWTATAMPCTANCWGGALW